MFFFPEHVKIYLHLKSVLQVFQKTGCLQGRFTVQNQATAAIYYVRGKSRLSLVQSALLQSSVLSNHFGHFRCQEQMFVFISLALRNLLFVSYQLVSIHWLCLVVLHLFALKYVSVITPGVALKLVSCIWQFYSLQLMCHREIN